MRFAPSRAVAVSIDPAPSRVPGFARAFREAILLALAFGLPLAFNPLGTLAFEPFKITLVRAAAIALVLSYAAEGWRTRSWSASRLLPGTGRPIVLGALTYLAACALATVCSVQPLQSLLGSYDRLQGLFTVAALLAVGLAVGGRPGGFDRLVDWLLAGSLPVCLYALLQQVKLDPLPWLGRTLGPASTVGSSTDLGGYLAMLVPLTLARVAVAGRGVRSADGVLDLLRQPGSRRYVELIVLAGLQVGVVFLTAVRGALFGLAAGLGVLAMLLLWRGVGRGRPSLLLGPLGAVFVVSVVLNLPATSLGPIRVASPYVERLGNLGAGDVSGRERLLIWRAAVETWAASGPRLLVGLGPETQAAALESRFPLELANRLPDLRFDRVHDDLLDHLLTTGAFGLVAYLAMLGMAARSGWHALGTGRDPWLPSALLAALAVYLVENAFAFGSASTLLVFWLALGILAGLDQQGVGATRWVAQSRRATRWVAPTGILLAALGLVPIVASSVLADLAYARALAYQAGRDRVGEVIWLRRAAALAPDHEIYSVALGLALANEANTEREAVRRTELLAEGEALLRDAVARERFEPYNYFHLGQVLMIRAEAERLPGAPLEAARAYDRAAELSPSRGLFLDAAGIALQQAERPEEALTRYHAGAELQGPGAERAARTGDCLVTLGRYDQARSSYQLALKLAPRLALAHTGLSELLHREGDLTGALNEARLAARFQFHVWRYREALAHLEAEMGHPAQAVAEARAAARFAPPWEQDRLRALISDLKTMGER